MLRVVIDTSVFVAGLLTNSPASSSYQIIAMWRAGAFTLVMSPQIMQELVAKLIDKGIDDKVIVELVTVIGKIALRIPGAYETTRLDNIDSSDNKFLAAAYEAQADCLVSLDKKHILPLKFYHNTQIITPELLIRQLIKLDE